MIFLSQKRLMQMSIISFMLSTVFALFCLFLQQENQKAIYQYKTSKMANTTIFFQPNPFYPKQITKANGIYPTSAIEQLRFTFQYHFSANQKLPILYEQSIQAKVILYTPQQDGDRKKIWTKTYPLQQSKTKQITQKSFTVKQSIHLYLQSYQQLVQNYEETYGISTEATLQIFFQLNYRINNHPKSSSIKEKIKLEIPLNEKTTEIIPNEKSTKRKTLVLTKHALAFPLTCSIFFFLLMVLSCLSLWKKKALTHQNSYSKTLTQLLKTYHDYIIKINIQPNLASYQRIILPTFDDVIRLAAQQKSVILCYEDENKQETQFYILNHPFVYLYVLNKPQF